MLASQALLGPTTAAAGSLLPSYSGLARHNNLHPRAPKTIFVVPRRSRNSSKGFSCRALEGQLSHTSRRVSVFGSEQELSGPQKFLEGLPAPARYVTSAVIVAGALAAGYALGTRYKGTQGAAVGGAVALGAVGGATAYALNSAAPHVAAVQLRNALVNHSDPKSLKPADIDAIANKYVHSVPLIP